LPDIGDELHHIASSLLKNIRDLRFRYVLKFLFLAIIIIIIIIIICILIVVIKATYLSTTVSVPIEMCLPQFEQPCFSTLELPYVQPDLIHSNSTICPHGVFLYFVLISK